MIVEINTLKENDIFIYPTEGVWGIGSSVWLKGACEQINGFKERRAAQDLLCVSAQPDLIASWIDWQKVAPEQKEFYEKHLWDFITFICPVNASAPTGPLLAIRLTQHPVITAIENHLGSPLWSSSANKHGLPPVSSAQEALKVFAELPVVDGALGGQGAPSRIYHLLECRWLR